MAVVATHVQEVLSRLEKVRSKSTGGWEALCPAHDDQRRSLGVGIGKDGKVLLSCGAGCTVEEVVTALGLTMRDLWPAREGVSGSFGDRNGQQHTPRHIVATYDYEDETGVLRFQVLRWEPKGFNQRRPVNGGWANTLAGGLFREGPTGTWKVVPNGETASGSDVRLEPIEPILYRVGELDRIDPTDPVFVVEGEKDADALWVLGLGATTSPMGADKWRPRYAQCLKGRRVVIIPDNDAPGRKHAAKVLESLAGLASAAVLELPDLPLKGDVSDWLAAGGTRDALIELAEAALKAGEPAVRRTAWLRDLVRAGAEVRWLWPGWIPVGVLTALAAEGGTGKTRFCADLLRRIRHQLPWPDGQPMNLPADSVALWVVADNHHDEMVTLGRDFDIEDGIAINAWTDDPYGGVMLDNPEDLKELEVRIVEVQPVFVVVDTVGNATDRNLGKQEDAKAFYQPLQVIARRHRLALLAQTHLNAAGKFLGRRVMEKVRVAISMEKPNPKDPRRALSVVKTNSQRPPALGLTMGSHGNEYDDHPPEEPESEEGTIAAPAGRPPSQIGPAVAWLRSQLESSPCRVSILIDAAKEADITIGTLYRAREALKLEQFETEGRKWWKLTDNEIPL